jgi:hypothetical protein
MSHYRGASLPIFVIVGLGTLMFISAAIGFAAGMGYGR